MRFDPHQEIANEVHEAPTEAQLIKTNRSTVEQMFESIGDENAARMLQPNTGEAARRLQTKQKPQPKPKPEPEPEPDTAPQKQLTDAQRRRKKKKRERQKQKKQKKELERKQQQELQSHDDSRIGESASMQPAIPELEEAPEL